MTKQDFQVIAIGLRRSRPDELKEPVSYAQWVYSVEKLAHVIGQVHPRFNLGMFIASCKAS